MTILRPFTAAAFSKSFWRLIAGCVALQLTSAASAQPTFSPEAFRPENFRPDKFFAEFFGDASPSEAELKRVRISWKEESQLGESAAKKYIAQLKAKGIAVTSRGKDVTYLRCLVGQLRKRMSNASRYKRLNILVADSDDTDAISFPGGTIIVFRGLIDFCENEAALVGIVGHELSHIDRGHQLYHLKRWKLAQQAFQGRKFDPRKMMSMGSMMAQTFARPFRPEEETEADLDGAKWAFELGYDAKQMADVFLRLHNRDRGKQVGMSFFRSHPFHIDRFEAILNAVEELEQKQPTEQRKGYIGQENLRQRVCRMRKRFPESATR